MDEEIDLKKYAMIIKKYFYIIAVIFFIVCVDTVVYTYHQPKVYEASSTIGIFSGVQVIDPFGTMKQTVNMETYKGILDSNAIRAKVSQETGFYPKEYTVSIENAKNSNIIKIIVESHYIHAPSVVANAIVDGFIEYNMERKQQLALSKKLFIDSQLVLYGKELESLNKKLLIYTEAVQLTDAAKLDKMSIERKIHIKSSLYNELLLKSEEINIAIFDNSGEIGVIDKAGISLEPVGPNIWMNYLIGFLLALFISIGTAVLIDGTRRKFR